MKYFAGIGSRETPIEVQKLMSKVSTMLECYGYTLRSGGANGADIAFELGICDPNNMNIYLPYDGFNDKYHDGKSYIYIDENNVNYKDAYASLKYHPRGFNLSRSAKQMMCRNYFQVMGINNQEPSEFIVCYTEDGKLKGGTAQALRIAIDKDIPIYNLGDKNYIHYNANDIVDIILSKDVEVELSSLF